MAEGERLAGALGDRKAIIMQNGHLTVGLGGGLLVVCHLERSCQAQLLAESGVTQAHPRQWPGIPVSRWAAPGRLVQRQPLFDVIAARAAGLASGASTDWAQSEMVASSALPAG